ncbi:MAG: hypothetical protein M3072_09760 [Candidatus Dormibacteraeota bacterium]|nr:hypothetical protein [Candidatus Dormibacteraeota bacterium]
METQYLDDEQIISLYNKVRAGRRSWPEDIWRSPAALQYGVTIFDYWIHNVMGWKGWPHARTRVTPALLEKHRLADIVEQVFVPEFGQDWLDFEVVLNESMRVSEDDNWAGDLVDRQERVESAFEHSFENILGSPKHDKRLLATYHRFRNHLMRMWGAFQEAQAEHDKAQREAAERFWQGLRLVRSHRSRSGEQWSILDGEEDRLGEVSMLWGDPGPYCLIVLSEKLPSERGGWEQVVWKLEQEVLVDEPGDVSYGVWQKTFLGEYYRCADCGELHNQLDEDPADELRVEIDDEE